MNRLTAFFKNQRQILTLFLSGVLLLISTACGGSPVQGANPDKPSAQSRVEVAPYQKGGERVKYNFSDTPKEQSRTDKSERDQAAQQARQLRAVHKDVELLYPGAETPEGRAKKEAEFPLITQKDFLQPEPGGAIQREPDLGTRVGERIETVKEAVKEATGFVKDKADEAGARPELQSNPAK